MNLSEAEKFLKAMLVTDDGVEALDTLLRHVDRANMYLDDVRKLVSWVESVGPLELVSGGAMSEGDWTMIRDVLDRILNRGDKVDLDRCNDRATRAMKALIETLDKRSRL